MTPRPSEPVYRVQWSQKHFSLGCAFACKSRGVLEVTSLRFKKCFDDTQFSRTFANNHVYSGIFRRETQLGMRIRSKRASSPYCINSVESTLAEVSLDFGPNVVAKIVILLCVSFRADTTQSVEAYSQ